MNFHYQKVLFIGATSGIGWALASKLVETGTAVVCVGRRKERLAESTKQHSRDGIATVDTAAFDITNLNDIPTFAEDMFEKHPDIDCVSLNSGLQRKVDWTEPESVDLETIEMEMLTNYTSFMHLTKAFWPRVQKQAPKETAMVYTSFRLGLVPRLLCPNYCASKAALHHMILAMREQLRGAKSHVKIIEIFPPAVKTELHDVEYGSEGKNVGMPLEGFIEEPFEALCSKNSKLIPVGAVKDFMGFNTWEQERQKTMHRLNDTIRQQGI